MESKEFVIKPILLPENILSSELSSSSNEDKISPRSRRSGKKVSFAADTLVPRENNLALSITKHAYTKELGYTQYTVDFIYHGISWSIHKRYRDFEDLYRQLQLENETFQLMLPSLPKKRWFEKQRWLNRFDESYGIKRRMELQDFMRILAKSSIIREKSSAFRSFISMPEDAQRLQQEELDAYLVSDEQKFEGGHSFSSDSPYRDSILETPLRVSYDDLDEEPCQPTVDPENHCMYRIEEVAEEVESPLDPVRHVAPFTGREEDSDDGDIDEVSVKNEAIRSPEIIKSMVEGEDEESSPIPVA